MKVIALAQWLLLLYFCKILLIQSNYPLNNLNNPYFRFFNRIPMKVFKKLLFSVIVVALSLSPYFAMAQIGPDPGCNPDEPCPIDSNVYILIIAALLFVGYKYYSTNRLGKTARMIKE